MTQTFASELAGSTLHGASIDDLRLEQTVRCAVGDHPQLKRRHLRFHARSGKVVMHGVVDSYYQKLMAQEIVRRMDGVEEIENHLEVHWQKAPVMRPVVE